MEAGQALADARPSFGERIGRLGWRCVDALMRIHESRATRPVNGRGGYVSLVPALAVVGVLAVALAYALWTSVHSYDSLSGQLGPLSLESYSSITDPYYIDAALRTLWMSGVATAISLGFAIPFAYVMVRTSSRLLRASLLVAIFVPFLTGELVRGYGWVVVLGRDGPVAWMLGLVGIDGFDAVGTPWAVILGIVQVVMPLCVLIVVPAMRSVDPDLEDAAGTMGAGRWAIWTRVVLPLAAPGIFAAATVAAALSLTEYAMPALLGGGFHDFVANLVYQAQFVQTNPAIAAALAAATLVFAALVVVLIGAIGRVVERRTGVAP